MKRNKVGIINLEDYHVKGAKVFAGRDIGRKIKNSSRINEIEDTHNRVVVTIPENIYSITPSFFEELFLDVVRKLGKERFLEKFEFRSNGNYAYESSLNEAIERISRTSTLTSEAK